jgi:hypothetical protein
LQLRSVSALAPCNALRVKRVLEVRELACGDGSCSTP